MSASNHIEQAKALAISQVAKGIEKLSPEIDALTSASLKRVLKAITMVRVGEEIVTGKTEPLQEKEQKIVDLIFEHQENVLGYLQLTEETQQGEENVVD